MKGIAHLGVLKALNDIGLLKYFDTFIGASVGSLIIGMYIIGYKPDRLLEFLKKFEIDKLNSIDFFTFFNFFGFDNGSNLEYVIKRLIKARGFSENITFKELFDKTKKKIVFSTVCENTKKTVYLSHETYPNLPLYMGLLMSSCVPFLFKPIEYKGDLFIDGGCKDNYPIQLSKDRLEETIGFYLLGCSDNYVDIENIAVHLYQIIDCYMEGHSYSALKGYEDYTITINTKNVNFIDFSLDMKQMDTLFLEGYKSVTDNISKIV